MAQRASRRRHNRKRTAPGPGGRPAAQRGRAGDLQPRVPDRLAELARQRSRGGRRPRRLRRLLATLLILAAGALAIVEEPPVRVGVPLVVVARDLPAGAVLAAGDLRTVSIEQAPDGAVADPTGARGRTLSGPVRRGEVLTDARLVPPGGPEPGPGRVAVPIRPADPGTAELLGQGVHVTLVGTYTDGRPRLLSRDAVVLAVQQVGSGTTTGRLVVVSVPSAEADRLTALSLDGEIAVRFS